MSFAIYLNKFNWNTGGSKRILNLDFNYFHIYNHKTSYIMIIYEQVVYILFFVTFPCHNIYSFCKPNIKNIWVIGIVCVSNNYFLRTVMYVYLYLVHEELLKVISPFPLITYCFSQLVKVKRTINHSTGLGMVGETKMYLFSNVYVH